MDLQWLIDNRALWAGALIAAIVAIAAPFFPTWNARLAAAARRLLGRPVPAAGQERGALQAPAEVLRFIALHEPDLLAGSARRAASGPETPAAAYYRDLDLWLEHGLPLLGKYGTRASDQSLIDLFRYVHRIGLGLHERGDGSSYRYLAGNPLDVHLGSRVDAAFYATADRLLASLLFSTVGRASQEAGDGVTLFAAAVRRAMADPAIAPESEAGADADAAAIDQRKAAQYLAIIGEILRAGSAEAAAMLRHLLASVRVRPAGSVLVAAGAAAFEGTGD